MDDRWSELKIECGMCSGLCCVALYFAKTDGFPSDKKAGEPCKNLCSDYTCRIHSQLEAKKMKGCLAYDCFGAGQKVVKEIYKGKSWKETPEKKEEIFQVFLNVTKLHQMKWYLMDTLVLLGGEFSLEANSLIEENTKMTSCTPEELAIMDVEPYRTRVNQLLKRVLEKITTPEESEMYLGRNFKRANLDKRNFSMSMLIASNLEGCSLRGTTFLGADMRDVNVRNTDLSKCIFLTQGQINSTIGNENTLLPSHIVKPAGWKNKCQ